MIKKTYCIEISKSINIFSEDSGHILTSYCALVHKISEHDEHLYEADGRELDLLLEVSGRICLCLARAAALERENWRKISFFHSKKLNYSAEYGRVNLCNEYAFLKFSRNNTF